MDSAFQPVDALSEDLYSSIEASHKDTIIVQPRYGPNRDNYDLDECLCDALRLMVRKKKCVTLRAGGLVYFLHYPGILEMIKKSYSATWRGF